MDDLCTLVRSALKEANQAYAEGRSSYRMESNATGEEVTVVFAGDRKQEATTDGRRQDISIVRRGDYYVMTSTIIKEARARSMGIDVFYPWLWDRNMQTDMVAFTFDKQGKLIGRIEPLASTVDAVELRFYIETLARECDQLEYLLTGVDR
jgi:hypothetical protein